jgi:hypothetical protein
MGCACVPGRAPRSSLAHGPHGAASSPYANGGAINPDRRKPDNRAVVSSPCALLAHRHRYDNRVALNLSRFLRQTVKAQNSHVPAVFEQALLSPAWQGFEQASFLISGILFWLPVITTPATWLVPLYLFLASLPCDTLGAFLVFCDHVVYPQYRHAHGAFNLSPLQDQALAGATMWVMATFAYMIAALVITTRLLAGPIQGQMGTASAAPVSGRKRARCRVAGDWFGRGRVAV